MSTTDKPAGKWTPAEVFKWVASLGFDDIGKKLQDEEVDGEALLELTAQNLRDEPFNMKFGQVKKLMKEIEALRPEGQTEKDEALPMAMKRKSTLQLSYQDPEAAAEREMEREKPHVPSPEKVKTSPAKTSIAPVKTGEGLKALQIVTPIAAKGNDSTEDRSVTIDKNNIQVLLDQIYAQKDGKDMEVAVVSVMGKFRGGKSFLLNLLSHYFMWLEENQERLFDDARVVDSDFKFKAPGEKERDWLPEWLPEKIQTPFTVDEKSDTMTCTQGLWILNKVFFLVNPASKTLKKTAVLLMDSQGADDGFLDESQSRAVLGITTVFSSTVIYNVKMPLDVKHVKDLGDLANIFQVALGDIPKQTDNDEDSFCVFGRLFFFLRDAKFTAGSTIPECKKKVIADAANKLDPERAATNRDIVKQLFKSFAPMELYGLPFPGDSADFAKSATTDNMRDLNENFKKLLDEFCRCTFEVDFPIPVRTCLSNKTLKADNLLNYLERIKDGFGSCCVAGGDPELIAMHREEVTEDEFVKKCGLLKLANFDEFPREEINLIKSGCIESFSSSLRKHGLSNKGEKKWVMKFESFCEGHVAKRLNEFNDLQAKGDKAVLGVAAGTVVLTLTPVGHILIGHAMVCAGGGAIATGAGYVRHTTERGLNPISPEAAQSFGKTSYDRGWEMKKSCKRMVLKGNTIVSTLSGASALANGNLPAGPNRASNNAGSSNAAATQAFYDVPIH